MRTARLLLLLVCLSGYAVAQDYIYATGNTPFGVNIPVENGFINIANGNLHLEFPLATHKQRGALQLNERLVYDSRIWRILPPSSSTLYYGFFPSNIPNTPDTQGGWRFVAGNEIGTISYPSLVSSSNSYCSQPAGGDGSYQQTVMSLAWSDPAGTVHPFNAFLTEVIDNCGWYTNYSQTISPGYASDASGYYIHGDSSGNPIVVDNNGTQVYPQVIDRFGNYGSEDGNGNLIDDLGRTPVIVTISGNVTYYDVLAPNGSINNGGTRVRYTVTTSQVTVFTHFNQSAVSEWAGNFYPIQSIQLPDGTSYSFTYDSYGEMTSVTLPTGGVINYGWTNFQDSYNNMNRWLSSRTIGSNPAMTFTPSVITQCASNGTGCQEKVVVHKPSGDETTYEQTLNNGAWNTKVSVYTGTASGTPVATTANAYSFQCSGCSSNYITKTSSVTTLPNGLQSQQQYVYDSPWLGKPSKLKEWDYYTGSVSSTPTRETDYTYAGYDLTQTTLLDNGVQAVQTAYAYTTSASPTSGVTQHGTANGGGPYLQSVTRWLNGGTSPVTTYSMDDTGMVIGVTDPRGNSTTISYQCSNTLPYQTVNPLGHTTTYGYDCNSGAVTSVKDANDAAANRAGTTYQYETTAGRPQSISYPDGGQTTYSYPSSTEVDTTVTATPNPSISSQYIVDSLGRQYQHVQAGVSTETSYDANGRPHCTTNPHFTSSSSSTDGSTCITSYDGLDRPLTQSQPDGTSTVSWSYSGNTTTYTDEASHSWQRTSDAFGNLKLVVEPGNLKTSYQYNALGSLKCVDQWETNSVGAPCTSSMSRAFSYDSLSRLITSTNPESGTVCYGVWNPAGCINGYDLNGNLTNKTDARNSTVNYSYDALNRLTAKQSLNLSYSYMYDGTDRPGVANGVGRLTHSSNNANGASNYDYDAMGRIVDNYVCAPLYCTYTLGAAASYDLAGNIASSRETSGRTVGMAYDGSGRLNGVTQTPSNSTTPSPLLSNLVYGPTGITQATLGNGLREQIAYDNRLRVTSYSVGQAASSSSGGLPPYVTIDGATNAGSGGSSVPQGGIIHAHGWAADNEDGAPVADVEVLLDGQAIGLASLGISRPDVATAYNRTDFTNSGWEFNGSIGTVTPGSHVVTARAYDWSGNSTVSVSNQAVTVTSDNHPFGTFEAASGDSTGTTTLPAGGLINAHGWAVDPEDGSPVATVKILLDGSPIGSAVLGGSRPDVASAYNNPAYGNSGWAFTGSIRNASVGSHTITAAVYDSSGNQTVLPTAWGITVTSNNDHVDSTLDSVASAANPNSDTVSLGGSIQADGWGAQIDHNPGSPVSRVEIEIDGQYLGTATLNVSRPDVASAYNRPDLTNSGWSFTGSVGNVDPGQHSIGARIYSQSGGSFLTPWVKQIVVQGNIPSLPGGATPSKYSYALNYGANGNLIYAADSVNGSWTYSYDGLNRLTSALSPTTGLIWNYDSFGNRWGQTVTRGQRRNPSPAFLLEQTVPTEFVTTLPETFLMTVPALLTLCTNMLTTLRAS